MNTENLNFFFGLPIISGKPNPDGPFLSTRQCLLLSLLTVQSPEHLEESMDFADYTVKFAS